VVGGLKDLTCKVVRAVQLAFVEWASGERAKVGGGRSAVVGGGEGAGAAGVEFGEARGPRAIKFGI
jgi:hypothetical protein